MLNIQRHKHKKNGRGEATEFNEGGEGYVRIEPEAGGATFSIRQDWRMQEKMTDAVKGKNVERERKLEHCR